MSDALMDQPKTNGQVAHTNPVDASAPQASGFDIVQILWRWKWLPILGSLIGAGLGFLYFSQLPATYEATSKVQVVNTIQMPTRNQFFDPSDKGITRADESQVIRSQRVLRKAVMLGKLNEQENSDFEGMIPDEVVNELMKLKSPLVIEPADKDDNTTLIDISYVSKDAEFAAKVVTAIVDGYAEYLQEEYKSVGDELGGLLANAKETLTDDYKRQIEKMKKYQRTSRRNVEW